MANSAWKKVSGIHWLILGVLGLLMILFREPFKDIMYALLGIGLIAVAVLGAADWWKTRSKSPDAIAKLLGYILLCLAGIWIMTHPAAFDKLINVVIVGILIIYGVFCLIRAMRPNKDVLWIVLSAAAIVLGLVIVCNNAATTWVVIAEGFGLIYTAVTGWLTEKKQAS